MAAYIDNNGQLLPLVGNRSPLPCEWRRMIKAGNINSFSQPTLPRKLDENNVVEIQALTSKKIYKKLVTKRTLEPTSKAKFTAIFSENNLDWANIYKIPFNSTLDRRGFQFKILHRILFINSALLKIKISAASLHLLWLGEQNREAPLRGLQIKLCEKIPGSFHHLGQFPRQCS